MRYSKPIHKTLITIDAILSDLNLRLPTNPAGLGYQKLRLTQTQKQLEALEEEIFDNYLGSYRDSTRKIYHQLLKLVRQLVHEADNLKHLAEEYPIDPEGSIACLNYLATRKKACAEELQQFMGNLKNHK